MTKTKTILGKLAVFVLTAMLSAAPVAAQEIAPEHLNIARRYVDLTDTAKVFEVALIEAGVRTNSLLIVKNPGVEEELNKAIANTIESYLPRKDELLNQFARVYAIRFSMEELEQIVAFYESDVGRKLSKANLEANQDLQAVMGVFSNNLRTEFLTRVRAELREMGIEL